MKEYFRIVKKEKQASWLVENNLLDLVAVGRAMIARPNWVNVARKEYIARNGIKNS